MLDHINVLAKRVTTAHGVGVDYDAALIKSAGMRSELEGVNAEWLIYDFNADEDDLFSQLVAYHVTHVFVYLVPKQLAMQTVRLILTRLCASGVVVCCHKFHPQYLTPARRDDLMGLVVYDETS